VKDEHNKFDNKSTGKIAETLAKMPFKLLEINNKISSPPTRFDLF